ncbi:hypothetical protein N8Z09_02725 [Methylophilaceae bacterium]|nr:hypothetical protein [Methylophilaceae bacterium]
MTIKIQPKLIDGKTSINLMPFIDFPSLLALKPYIDYAVVKSSDTASPSRYDHRQFFHEDAQGDGLLDVLPKYKNSTEYPFISDLKDKDQLASWLTYHEDVYYGHTSIQVIYCKSWATRHLSSECVQTDNVKYFQPFLDWLDNSNIFSQYGRIVVYLSQPGTKTLRHFDHADPNVKDEFIWVNLDSRKRFFVYDENTDTKHYVDGSVATFDDSGWHGSEPMEFNTYSIRIDGVFNDEFLKKSGMYSHFRS